jgi:hypothetical protein
MKPRNRFLKGQIAVIMTLIMATLLGAMALGVDVGVLYYNWVLLQKAADSAVLSGALYLTGDQSSDSKVESAVTQVVMANGVTSSEIVAGPTVGADQYSVSVKLQRTVPYFFGKVLGLNQGLVSVYSAAKLAPTSAPKGIRPVGLECPTGSWNSNGNCNGSYNQSTVYSLNFKGSTQSGTLWAPGNWGALALGQGGTSTFEQNVTYGYNGLVPLNGQLSVDTQTGDGAPRHFDQAFQAQLPCGSWSCAASSPPAGVDPSNAQVILVPVVDFNGQAGKSTLPVEGFAEMFVVPPGTGGCTGDICAYFVTSLAHPGLVANNSTCSTTSAENSCTPVLTN